ncbi:hypothetical protein QR721_13185 [Aciduricibacillus chroicocephali]|uniref:Permease n=1 Tax=Aciduricibacillus chroicocephali TaxID=3054939 RepID=A0ABY9KUU8_9BACI|nr:hypothetical protein QR721_13185 [Bacillaceae bacterium 44XB]
MHTKKYLILLVPTVLIGLVLLFFLPESQRSYVLFVPLIFWIVYYAWIYVEKRKH